MSASLDLLLNDDDDNQAEPETKADDTPPAPEAQADDAPPPEPEKPETDDKPAEPESKAPPSEVPTAALQDERTKRQAAEYELNLLRQRLAQPATPEKPAEPPKFDFDDTDGYSDKVADFVKGEVSKVREESRAALAQMSVNYARRMHDDFDAKLAAFDEAAKANPQLIDQARASDDPGRFIYEAGTYYAGIGKYGSVAEWEKAIRAEAAAAAQATPAPAPTPEVPKDTSATPSASVPKDEPVEDESLDQILGKSR